MSLADAASPPATSPESPWKLLALVFGIALVARLIVIAFYPDPWQFDAYQRWAARDHLWVQVWLPATQVVVWTVAKLGGSIFALRLVMATLAAATVTMGAALAHRLGGRDSVWLYIPMALFGPYLLWSVVPYQESTLLLALFGGLLLQDKRPVLGALVMGTLAFCRYEGWPLLVVFIVVQRRWSSLWCLWGVGLYFLLDGLGLNEPYAASPDSFEDWEGLENKLTWRNTKRLFEGGWYEASNAGLPWVFLGALFALRSFPRWRVETWVLVLAFLGQAAATIGWMFSLGLTFSRMAVLPGMVIAVVAAAAVGRRWNPMRRDVRLALVGTSLAIAAWSVARTVPDVNRMFRTMRREVEVVRVIESCPEDSWAMRPRKHPGPRRRHDACEVVQGLTNLRAGQDFDCETWNWGGTEPTMRVEWDRQRKVYVYERVSGEPQGDCPL